MKQEKAKAVMLLGAGPVSVQIAVLLKKYNKEFVIGVSGRGSEDSEKTCEDIRKADMQVEVMVQNPDHKALSGCAKVDCLFRDYGEIQGTWDTLFLNVPCDAYTEVLKKLPRIMLPTIKKIILISPCIGSTAIVNGFLKLHELDVEVVTCSTYLGAIKREKSESRANAFFKNKKKRLYVASTRTHSATVKTIKTILRNIGIEITELRDGFAVEARNVSTYVHLPFLFNPFSLNHIFDVDSLKVYTYKLFPQGPITPYVIRDMLTLLYEIREVLSVIGVKKFNFLKFLNDDVYSVKAESIAKEEIANFEKFGRTRQEYLLYVRYASILVDPYSKPNKEGRYFDFSAVPMQKIHKVAGNRWEIPRMPGEDFYRLYLLKGIADILGIQVATIDEYMDRYRAVLAKFKREHPGDLLFGEKEMRQYACDLDLTELYLRKGKSRQ